MAAINKTEFINKLLLTIIINKTVFFCLLIQYGSLLLKKLSNRIIFSLSDIHHL